MTAEIELEIEMPIVGDEENYEFIKVEFKGTASIQDDSFDHAFGTEVKQKYLIIEEILWDKEKHTERENTLISVYLDIKKNREEIETELIDSITDYYDNYD